MELARVIYLIETLLSTCQTTSCYNPVDHDTNAGGLYNYKYR